jgi:hypothetical protein
VTFDPEQFRQALEIEAEKANNSLVIIAMSYNDTGEVLRQQGKREDALEQYRRPF